MFYLPLYCSFDNSTIPKQNNQVQTDDGETRCCNNVPWNEICGTPFDPNATVSLWCNGFEYIINCNCCRALWIQYGSVGNPPRLNYDGPPCPGDLHFFCNEIPELH